MEKIKEYLKERPWLIGILIAIPVVLVIYIFSRKRINQGQTEEYQGAGMIYQPPVGGGGGAVSSGPIDSGGSETVSLLTSFLEGISKQQEAQRAEMQGFLQAQAEAQKSFMENLADVWAGQQKSIQDMLSSFLQGLNTDTGKPAMMPDVPKVETRQIYFSPEKSFSIPKGVVSVADMPGKTEDEKWAQFEQTIAYDYLGSTAREAQSRIRELQAQWWSARSEEEKRRIHQLAQAERQRVYQELTRGGAGFTATWKDTGVGYQELEVRTPKGEILRL